MKTMKLLVGAALTAAAFGAAAADTDLFDLSAYSLSSPFVSNQTRTTTFSDTYTFDVVSGAPLASEAFYSTLTFYNLPVFDFSNFSLTLHKSNGYLIGTATLVVDHYVLHTSPLAVDNHYYF